MSLNKLNDSERLAVALIALTPYADLDAAHEAVLDRLQDELEIYASESGATLDGCYCPERFWENFVERVKQKYF